MRVVKRLHVVHIGLALALIGCVPPKPNPSLCELAHNREAYAGRAVTVEGVLLVSRHGSVVIDPQCGWGIGISWYDDDVPWIREFDAMVARSFEQDMMVRARVTGIVRRETQGSFGLPPAWIIKLAKADVLEAYPVSEAEHERFLDWLDGPHDEPFRPKRQ